jgi:hypothetical protein
MPEATTARVAIDDIAKSMLFTPDPAPVAEQEEEQIEETQAQDDDLEEDSDAAETAESEEEATDEDTAEEGENSDAYELTDDTVLAVTVDGEQREVTLADLKKAYSGEGAIEKRLQEATLQRKEAEAERQRVQQELQTGRERLVKAFQSFDHLMFQPRVQKPDPSLQQTNPQQYLLQMERYRDDQAQLGQRRQQVQSALQTYEQQQAQELQQMRQQNAQKLVEVMPQLNDPVEGPKMRDLILTGAQAYGFTPEEIGMAVDYRLFQMAADAAAYRKLKEGAKVQPKPTTTAANKTKVIRPGGQQAVTAAKVNARQQQAAIQRAQKTGRPEDVAATMLVRKPR